MRQYNIKLFLGGFMTYFMGSLIPELFFPDQPGVLKWFFIAIVGIITGMVLRRRTHPEVIEEILISEGDERLVSYKHRAAYYTMLLVLLAALILMFVLEIMNQSALIISGIGAGLLLMLLVYWLIYKVLTREK